MVPPVGPGTSVVLRHKHELWSQTDLDPNPASITLLAVWLWANYLNLLEPHFLLIYKYGK